jgi:hypothetical protein
MARPVVREHPRAPVRIPEIVGLEIPVSSDRRLRDSQVYNPSGGLPRTAVTLMIRF